MQRCVRDLGAEGDLGTPLARSSVAAESAARYPDRLHSPVDGIGRVGADGARCNCICWSLCAASRSNWFRARGYLCVKLVVDCRRPALRPRSQRPPVGDPNANTSVRSREANLRYTFFLAKARVRPALFAEPLCQCHASPSRRSVQCRELYLLLLELYLLLLYLRLHLHLRSPQPDPVVRLLAHLHLTSHARTRPPPSARPFQLHLHLKP